MSVRHTVRDPAESRARLQKHQIVTLSEELSRPEYRAMTAEEAYVTITNGSVQKRLARTRYVKGLDGFPNKVRRADFAIVWEAIHGAT